MVNLKNCWFNSRPQGFIPKAKELFERMEQQGSKRGTTGASLRKIILALSENLQHFSISCHDLLNIFSEDQL